ncbi:NADH-quinone oxidoreductase subunit J [Rhodococcus sp. IEGM 1408]|uniref:NADH-quinone oxidoreductase subunit J n=1 Tax=Rhodococcus sp. IEGM 1408 TaxID=3082220 RepID=UPI002954FDFB|nr:NADH-quinone oxidoreductase subunit J [Rhodococcus sp. IEGM 1408]MDV8002165.1 NADH-quinone oxidoreductase subunit J [Rhodococcus sp. IEGM 1408]
MAGGSVSTGESVLFWVLAVVVVVGALGVVSAKKAVYSALCLAATMIALAVLYIAQGAVFLGVGQIVVYTGAVMMLFLFVVMLIGVESSESLVERIRGHRVAALVAGIGFGVLLATGLARAELPPFTGFGPGHSDVPALAELLFSRHVWAFELTGVLLIIATLGAMVLAHRERFTGRRTQRELSEQRFLDWQRDAGARVTPLPSSGVYARRNSADIPARLPDGSDSVESVSEILRRRAGEVPGRGEVPDRDEVRGRRGLGSDDGGRP